MTDLQLELLLLRQCSLEKRMEKILNADLGEEERFRNYARGMLNTLMKELNIENRDRVLEKALQDFFAMNGY